MLNHRIGDNLSGLEGKVNKPIYRDPIRGKIAGVCAGIAEYFSVDPWLVRGVAIVAFFVGFGVLTTVVYIAVALLMDKKPLDAHYRDLERNYGQQHQGSHHYQQGQHAGDFAGGRSSTNKYSQAGRPISLVLEDLDKDINALEKQTSKIESYVTSSEFELNRQFRQL